MQIRPIINKLTAFKYIGVVLFVREFLFSAHALESNERLSDLQRSPAVAYRLYGNEAVYNPGWLRFPLPFGYVGKVIYPLTFLLFSTLLSFSLSS